MQLTSTFILFASFLSLGMSTGAWILYWPFRKKFAKWHQYSLGLTLAIPAWHIIYKEVCLGDWDV